MKKIVANISGGATMEAGVQGGQAIGTIAQRLMASNFKVSALRRFGGNATLQKDEWIELDRTVLEISTIRLRGVNDLISRGLVVNISNAMGKTVYQFEDASDMTAASMTMDGAIRGENDRVVFELNSLPLPIIFKNFQLSARNLAASRDQGIPLNTRQAGICARKVAEKAEEILFTGSSSFAFGGGTLYGYQDFPSRNTGSLTANWDASAATGEGIVDDVRAMKQASIDAKHYGPWGLYVPTKYETVLDDDHKANSERTIRERILALDGIEFASVADQLSANNVVLVELSPESVNIIVGMQPTTIEWELEGGLITHFKVMAILVPLLLADQDGQSGLVHFT